MVRVRNSISPLYLSLTQLPGSKGFWFSNRCWSNKLIVPGTAGPGRGRKCDTRKSIKLWNSGNRDYIQPHDFITSPEIGHKIHYLFNYYSCHWLTLCLSFLHCWNAEHGNRMTNVSLLLECFSLPSYKSHIVRSNWNSKTVNCSLTFVGWLAGWLAGTDN